MTRTCKRCGTERPVDDFRIDKRHSARGGAEKLYRRAVCIPCEIDKRMEARQQDPFTHAFTQRRRNHATRWGYSVKQLEEWGWRTPQRSAEMRVQYEYGYCPDCVELDGTVHFYRDMTDGLSELTIDRWDPTQPPRWPGNIRWCCETCNKRKGPKSPAERSDQINAEHAFRLAEQTVTAPVVVTQSLFGEAS